MGVSEWLFWGFFSEYVNIFLAAGWSILCIRSRLYKQILRSLVIKQTGKIQFSFKNIIKKKIYLYIITIFELFPLATCFFFLQDYNYIKLMNIKLFRYSKILIFFKQIWIWDRWKMRYTAYNPFNPNTLSGYQAAVTFEAG